jgi:hypothetical protein
VVGDGTEAQCSATRRAAAGSPRCHCATAPATIQGDGRSRFTSHAYQQVATRMRNEMTAGRRSQRFTWSRKKGQSEKQEIVLDQTFEIDATALELISRRIYFISRLCGIDRVHSSVDIASTHGVMKIKLTEVWTLGRSFEALAYQDTKRSASKQRSSIVRMFYMLYLNSNVVSSIVIPLQLPDSWTRRLLASALLCLVAPPLFPPVSCALSAPHARSRLARCSCTIHTLAAPSTIQLSSSRSSSQPPRPPPHVDRSHSRVWLAARALPGAAATGSSESRKSVQSERPAHTLRQ